MMDPVNRFAQYQGSTNGYNVNLTDTMKPFSMTVAQAIDCRSTNQCIVYSRGIGGDYSYMSSNGSNSTTSTALKRRSTVFNEMKPGDDAEITEEDVFTAPHDRTDMYRLRIPDPIPESFIRCMGYDAKVIRTWEKRLAAVNAKVNAKTRRNAKVHGGRKQMHAKNCLLSQISNVQIYTYDTYSTSSN